MTSMTHRSLDTEAQGDITNGRLCYIRDRLAGRSQKIFLSSHKQVSMRELKGKAATRDRLTYYPSCSPDHSNSIRSAESGRTGQRSFEKRACENSLRISSHLTSRPRRSRKRDGFRLVPALTSSRCSSKPSAPGHSQSLILPRALRTFSRLRGSHQDNDRPYSPANQKGPGRAHR